MAWKGIFHGLRQGPATEAASPTPEADITTLAARLQAAAFSRLGRTLAIRHVDSGSCNGCELEIRMLTGIVYDLERFGLRFVASPRHADILLATGPVTRTMHQALIGSWQATPDPKWVVAIGDCAIDGGVFKGSYAITGGIDSALPVDLLIRGCPPAPAAILDGLCTLVEANAREPRRPR